MTWKKYFKTTNISSAFYKVDTDSVSPISGRNKRNVNGPIPKPGLANWESNLPDIYIGHPNRIDRYGEINRMDMDAEINAALDILAEFCTQPSKTTGLPFEIRYNDKASDSEIKIIKEQLQQWCKINSLESRIFRIFRNTLKYGDQIFVRDPETFQMYWVEIEKVTKIIVNESAGKEPEQYFIKDLAANLAALSTAAITATTAYTMPPGGGSSSNYSLSPPTTFTSGGADRFVKNQSESAIPAEHIIHLSLSEGLDSTWPFASSILETVYKVFKQKELLEDAVIIYRLNRAPERRVFKIDVGNMPSHMAMAFVEKVKNEIQQRRIPTKTGGGNSITDATYSPLSINEDFYFPVSEGRGSSVEILPGGQSVGEVTDLRYFTNKLFRGLRIPSSYLPLQADEGERTFVDGKVGTALIQEWRFNQYCKRLQSSIISTLDKEFKMFMNWRGINIDSSLFNLTFTEPQNFAQYRQAELDSGRIQAFTQIESLPYMSKRFMLKRYLGLTEEEIQQNEEMWREERGNAIMSLDSSKDMRSMGVTPGGVVGDMSVSSDLGLEGKGLEEPLSGIGNVDAGTGGEDIGVTGTDTGVSEPTGNTPPETTSMV